MSDIAVDTQIYKVFPENLGTSDADEAIRRAKEAITAGRLVAFPTETVYGLGGDATNPKASEKIYAAKGRPSDNPLIVHIAAREDIYGVAEDIPESAPVLAEAFWPGPLTMILKKGEAIPYETTGGLDTVALRLPDHAVARALIAAVGVPIAAPSANISGRPSPTDAERVSEDLGGRIDIIIDGGPSEIGLESTIIDLTEEVPMILRPGAITREMLSAVIGEVRMDPGLLTPPDSDDVGTGAKPKAPGMRYRHYAPRGELTIISGEASAVANDINLRCKNDAAAGYRTGVMASAQTGRLYEADIVIPVGDRDDGVSVAQNLYRSLRRFDEEGIDRIYSEDFSSPGIGVAVMNRLLRAAEFRVEHIS